MVGHPLDHLTGAEFPGGWYSIEGYQNWLAHDALYSDPRVEPHPIMAFIGAQQGMGMTVAQLFTWLESDIDDGPLLAQCDMDFLQPLKVDVRYRVSGMIESIVRKQGRSIGEFDLVKCKFQIEDGDGAGIASIVNTYAIARGMEGR